MFTCQVCENTNSHITHVAHEMMYGFRDSFEYVECSKCGCIQIKEIPHNLDKYYPEEYWSSDLRKRMTAASQKSFKGWLRQERTKFYLNNFSLIGLLTSWLSRPREIPIFSGWTWIEPFQRAGIKPYSALLDVGCGAGVLIEHLRREGFSNVTGIDPFIREEYIDEKIKILKKEIYEIEGSFDLIMLHHSFEHMPNPLKFLDRINSLLKQRGRVIVRIPVASYAWSKYGVFWVQLDAPRHLFLHTIKSMNILAEKTGFEVENIKFDSNEFQILGSEQYLKNIPLNSQKSYFLDPESELFSADEIEEARQFSRYLNNTMQGDQACFYLKKT